MSETGGFICKYIGQSSQRYSNSSGTDYRTCLWDLKDGAYCGTFSGTLYGNPTSDLRAIGFVTGFIGLTPINKKINRINIQTQYNADAYIYNDNYLAIKSSPDMVGTSRPYFCSLAMSVTGSNLTLPVYHSWIQ